MFDAAVQHVRALQAADKRVVVGAWSEGSRERLCHVLDDHGLTQTKTRQPPRATRSPCPRRRFRVAVWGLEAGFEAGDLAVLSEQDILGDRLVRPKRKSKRPQDFLTEVAAPDARRPRRACRSRHRPLRRPADDRGGGRAARLPGAALCRRRPPVPAGREHRASVALRLGGHRGRSSTGSAAAPGRRARRA